MFGSIGGPEILLIFVLALLLFGPRRLPEIGKTIGKTLGEFRRATSEFTVSLEREVEIEKLKEVRSSLRSDVLDATTVPAIPSRTAPALEPGAAAPTGEGATEEAKPVAAPTDADGSRES
jgi:TatA/E family protein of Tat protein translocase